MDYIKFDELYTQVKLNINDFTRNHLVNKTLYWSGSDQEQDFKKRIKKEGHTQTVQHYLKNPIEYTYNNFGYRTYDDFNRKDKGIVTLGCSYTEGVGLHLEHTWSYRIAKKLNKKFWNLGEGGFGLDKCYYNLLFFIDYLLFDDIFLLIPPKFRFCFYTQDNPFQKNSNDIWKNKSINGPFNNRRTNEILFSSETTESLRQLTYLHAIKYLAITKNKNLYILDVDSPIDDTSYDEYNFEARDGHAPPNTHLCWYALFMKQYETQR